MSARTRLLAGVWALFFVLVALGVHGSSTGVTARWWDPGRPYGGLFFESLRSRVAGMLSPERAQLASWLFMTVPQEIRWDEYVTFTPFALSQLSHRPPFPVINRSVGTGRNALAVPDTPVAHVLTLARPATWGFFVLGAQRGLAWFWWFRVFGCFTVLFLLLEVVLRGHTKLAAFGAFWFCGSAYVVCWTLWAAHVTFFALLGCLAGYHLLASAKPVTQLISAILLGLSVPGFVMILYPPWQVQIAYLVAALYGGLFWRDRLDRALRPPARFRLICVALSALIAGGLLFSFFSTCWEDLAVMAGTIYPGQRVSLGGNATFPQLFRGMYNWITIYRPIPALDNTCEAAAFYLLFPAVLAALALWPRLRRSLGAIGWLLVAYLGAALLFLFVGLPEPLARLTLLSYVTTQRADFGVGLASVMLCVIALAAASRLAETPRTRWERRCPAAVAVAVTLFFGLHGALLLRFIGWGLERHAVLAVSLLAGIASFLLLRGRKRLFCGLVGTAVALTGAWFNPLATDLDHLYRSELAKEVSRLDPPSGDRPLWLCYGEPYPGVLVSIVGGRSLTGTYWPPQMPLWRLLDPEGANRDKYNRFAEISLSLPEDPDEITIGGDYENTYVDLGLAPSHPVATTLGARYVLALNDPRVGEGEGLRALYRSAQGNFSIFEIQRGP